MTTNYQGHTLGPVQDLHAQCTQCGRSILAVHFLVADNGLPPAPYCLVAAERAIDKAKAKRDALRKEGEALAHKSLSWWRTKKSRAEYRARALRLDAEANSITDHIRQMRQRVEHIRQTQDNPNFVPAPRPNDPRPVVKAIDQAKEFGFAASLIQAGHNLIAQEEQEIRDLEYDIAAAKKEGLEYDGLQARLNALRSLPEHKEA